MIYSTLFLLLSALSYRYWRTRFLPAEVTRNLLAFQANGSQDNLQQGYHSRESWRRIWVGVACCGVPAGALVPTGGWAAALGFLAVAALLAGCFARYFSPLLNLARIEAGETWLSEWTASPASKSWPDAAAWVKIRRADYPTAAQESVAASRKMRVIVLSAWFWCRVAAGVLASGAVWLALK